MERNGAKRTSDLIKKANCDFSVFRFINVLTYQNRFFSDLVLRKYLSEKSIIDNQGITLKLRIEKGSKGVIFLPTPDRVNISLISNQKSGRSFETSTF